MLISAAGYNADYFLPNCLHFCFYFEESLDHQESMNVLWALQIDPYKLCFSGGRKRKRSPDGERASEESSNLTPLITWWADNFCWVCDIPELWGRTHPPVICFSPRPPTGDRASRFPHHLFTPNCQFGRLSLVTSSWIQSLRWPRWKEVPRVEHARNGLVHSTAWEKIWLQDDNTTLGPPNVPFVLWDPDAIFHA